MSKDIEVNEDDNLKTYMVYNELAGLIFLYNTELGPDFKALKKAALNLVEKAEELYEKGAFEDAEQVEVKGEKNTYN